MKKGAHGTIVSFWKVGEYEKDTGEKRDSFLLRYYRVFNLEQTEGIAEKLGLNKLETRVPSVETRERIFAEIPQRPRMEDSNAAWYRPLTDTVGMPHKQKGRVVYAGVAPTAPKKKTSVMVQLMPRDFGNNLVDYPIGSGNFAKADGTFELLGVLPGAYVLTAQMFDENGRHFAVQDIDVGNANVEGLQIIITPGIPISGHVHWDGSPGSQNQDVNLVLSNLDSERLYGGHASVLADGSFSFKEVNDGNYRVISWGLSQDSYLANVSYGGFDSAKGEIRVRHAIDSSLEITYSSRGARVQGTVSDSDGLPSAGVYVALVPDTASRDDTRLYKSTQTDQRGLFTIRGVKPGDYKLFSWDEVEDGAWEDPDFLKSFEDKGQAVTVQAADTKSFNIVAIKTAHAEAQKP